MKKKDESVKFKVRCSRYLYTLTVGDKDTDLMGKKRQKVQWFPVDGLQWTGENEKEYQAESTDVGGPAPSNGVKEVKGGKEKGGSGSRRTSGQGWSSAVAPRFERRVIPVETGESGAGA